MLYALNWFIVLVLLGLWSLAAWVFHAVGVWTLSNAGALTDAAAGMEPLQVPPWLAPWVPPELVDSLLAMLAPLGALLGGLLQSAPALAGGVGVITWVVWGLGAFTLVALGAGAHTIIALWRRRAPRGAAPA